MRVRRYAVAILLATVLAACSSTRRVPWTDADGRSLGEIVQTEVDHGYHYEYVNADGLVARFESRDPRRQLTAGPCSTTFEYDQDGRVVAKQFLDASEAPATFGGFSSATYEYSTDDGHPVEVRTLFDTAGGVCVGDEGFARARIVFRPGGSGVREIVFSDATGGPAAATWNGVAGTARVEYTVVRGVGDVVYGVYFDGDGVILKRQPVSGRTWVEVVTSHQVVTVH